MRRILLLACMMAALFGALPAYPARADELALPGLASDADTYVNGLQKRFPAGGSDPARAAAEQQAAAALDRKDVAAAIAALERRVALGQPSAGNWLGLAQALAARSPPDARRAALAAWRAYDGAEAAADKASALRLLADALRAQGRNEAAVQALEQLVQLAPDDAADRRLLADAQRAAGFVLRRVVVEGEADPPRACMSFSVPPTRSPDFDAQDWVRLAPPAPGAAVTHEGDQICVSGLPSGATTRAILRAGLPASRTDAGTPLVLAKDLPVDLMLPNRSPRVVFDTRLFVLPRGQAPAVSLGTVNLSSVSLRLFRLTERNVAVFLRENRLGDAVEQYAARGIGEDTGRLVWQGRADIPNWQSNKIARTALPMPPPLLTAGPGLYALIAAPGDGTDASGAASVQMILRTDLAPTVWRGADGLTVQVRGYSDAAVRPGVRLQLLARNNDVLGEAATGADGVARFPVSLLRGKGPLAPAVLHAFGADDDFAALDLNAAAFDLSDRGVEGAAQPGPLDSFVWLDRGIYRPGETVRVMALLRDDAGAPADFPAHVTIRRPNGQVFSEATPARGGDASLYLPVKLSASAAAGTWVVEVRADPKGAPIGRAEFRVDAFVPDRMAVELGNLPKAIVAGQEATIPVAARFLYGAPGSGLSGRGFATINVDPQPYPALAGYVFGLRDEAFAPQQQNADLPATDAQGHTGYALTIARAPDTTRPLKADVMVEVNDPAGHGSRAAASIPLRPPGPMIGVRPAFDGGAVNAGAEAGFDIVALDPDGARIRLAARLRLVRERPDWHMVVQGRLAHYETVYRDEPLETRSIDIGTATSLHFAKTLPFGRYRIEVTQADSQADSQGGGLAATSLRFSSGWTDTDSPDVPDRVDVSTAQRSVAAGDVAHIHIAPPFAGQATLLVLSDRVRSLRTLDVPAGGVDVDVPVDAGWGAGAYVAVHVFRPAGGDGTRPARAIGLTWVGVDPAARTLAVAIDTPDRVTPRAVTQVAITTAPGAWVSLAAVDEGILRLTRFASPDPGAHFLGRRSLGLDIRDDWGRLIAPAQGEATLLHQGGDEGSFVLAETPQHTVTLFSPPVQAGPDGRVSVPLDLPDFNGQVRLMAVAWSGSRIGAANHDLIVRDALVAEPLLPRFLAPGDTTRLAMLLDNLDLPAGPASVRVTVDGPLSLPAGGALSATLAGGAKALLTTDLRATGAGRGVLHFDVTGPAGFHIQREAAILVRPARGATTALARVSLPPGVDTPLALPAPFDRFVAGTALASVTFGAAVRYDPDALLRELEDYPLSCLEQLTSQALPLALRPDTQPGALAGLVAAILDRQRFDGGFGLWSANAEPEPWLSAYAMDLLLRAKAAGMTVPEAALADGLKYLADAADSSGEDPAAMAAQAYRLYVLARAGQGRAGAVRVLAENIAQMPTPLSRAQLGAALALAHDTPRAEAAFRAALTGSPRQWWMADYGSALRDQAAIVLLLRESGVLPDRLAGAVAALPGANLDPRGLDTQEQAWLVAVAAVLGRDGVAPRVSLDGRELVAAKGVARAAITGPATARNLGDKPLAADISVRGVPVEAPPAARAGMRVTRQFFAADGGTLDLDHMTQNTVFVLLFQGRADDGQDHRAMLLQGLPAGWEIVGKIASGEQATMPWLGRLTDTEAEPSADDRYAAVLALTGDAPDFRVAVRLRATTPGDYEMPGAELSDMYRPGVFARQAGNRIKVLPRD